MVERKARLRRAPQGEISREPNLYLGISEPTARPAEVFRHYQRIGDQRGVQGPAEGPCASAKPRLHPRIRIRNARKRTRYIDGALLYSLRVPLGYWEGKDEEDDLDEEIEKKKRAGYPQDNIIFEDSITAVLIQNREEAMRCPIEDTDALAHLLKLFFEYEREEIADFQKAVRQFQTDLPAVLKALRDMIEEAHRDNAAFRAASEKFLAHAKEAINPTIGEADVREMLIQHILTEEIFTKVFDEQQRGEGALCAGGHVLHRRA